MITIQTKNYTSTDIAELFEALKTIHESHTKGINSTQLKVGLDYTLRYLNEKYAEKLKAERNRS